MTQPLDPQEEYRRISRDYELTTDQLRAHKGFQRAYWALALSTGVLTLILGYSVAIALWKQKPDVTRYVGLIAVVVAFAGFSRLVYWNCKRVVELDIKARYMLHDKQVAVSAIALESVESLKIYRESSLDLIDHYRRRAGRNRRVHNSFQGVVIIGSILASTSTALDGPSSPASWAGVSFSTIVSISAGIIAYFKFRERGHNLQATADELEKHYKAAEFGLDEYADHSDERDRLRLFAQLVEQIKDEQRKRELQLEQSPSSKGDHG